MSITLLLAVLALIFAAASYVWPHCLGIAVVLLAVALIVTDKVV